MVVSEGGRQTRSSSLLCSPLCSLVVARYLTCLHLSSSYGNRDTYIYLTSCCEDEITFVRRFVQCRTRLSLNVAVIISTERKTESQGRQWTCPGSHSSR